MDRTSDSIRFLDLVQALFKNFSDGMPNSLQIRNLFLTNTERALASTEQEKKIKERFAKAKEVFQNVDGRDYPAFFYKLSDKETVISEYQEAYNTIQEQFHEKVAQVTQPLTAMLIQDILKEIQRVNATKKLFPEIVQCLLSQADLDKLIPSDMSRATKTFDEWFLAKKEEVNNLALKAFFKMDMVDYAVKVGCIYAPEAKHNWMMNACWTLSSVMEARQVVLLSELTGTHGVRRKKAKPSAVGTASQSSSSSSTSTATTTSPSVPTSDSTVISDQISAFALEISIAIKMDYGLNISPDGCTVELIRPDKDFNDKLLQRTLPTKEEQLRIYNQCVLARELYVQLSNISALQHSFHAQLTSSNPTDKPDLILALEHLRKGDCLPNILSKLSEREIVLLNHALTTERQFQSPTFNELRGMVNHYMPKNTATSSLPPLNTHSPQNHNEQQQRREATSSNRQVQTSSSDGSNSEDDDDQRQQFHNED